MLGTYFSSSNKVLLPPLELLFQMNEQQSVLVIYFVTYAPLKCVHDMKTCVYNCDTSSTPRSAVRYLESFFCIVTSYV